VFNALLIQVTLRNAMPVNEMRGKRTTEDRLMCLKKFAWREAADFRYFQSFFEKKDDWSQMLPAHNLS
jgi:hypothetical protein